jgi:hypothetical protein
MNKTLLATLLLPLALVAGNPFKSHLGFCENKGQVAGPGGKPATNVLFKVSGTAPGIFVTTQGLTYVFYKTESDPDTRETKSLSWSKIDLTLKNADISAARMEVSEPLPGVSNFYYAHCPEGILNVKTWQQVTFKNVYPGIDWVLKGSDVAGLAYDFVVHPGADPSQIRLQYKGAEKIELLENNSKILLRSRYGEMCEGSLRVLENGKELAARFKSAGSEVSLSINGHDSRYEMIIDPPLQWNRKLLSSGPDYGTAVAVPRDATGDVLITGFAGSTDFPVLNAYQGSNAGNDDIVIARLNASGTTLWATYYGGSGSEGGKGIGADVAGNCYVAGYTNSGNFPTLNPLYAAFQGGGYDVAILKLNNSGVRQWATYFGNMSTDYGNALVTDPAGNCYITGYTNSVNFPTLNAIQPVKNNVYDAFVMKINSSCALQWATFYGGDDEDRGRGITLDPAGANVFVTGTAMGQFPLSSGSFQTGPASPYQYEDGFVVKLSASNAAVQYSTLLGASDADYPEDVAVDNAGNAYVTGYTFSSNFPVVNPGGGAYVDSSLATLATHDVFITKLNSTGTAALWSTYFGGTSVDMAFGICYDPFYGIYIVGATSSTDFPLQIPADNVYYQATHGDGGNFLDFFVTWFNTGGVLQWSTYYGNANGNEAKGVDTDAGSNIFVCGSDSDNVELVKFAPGLTTGILAGASGEKHLKAYPVPARDELQVEAGLENGGAVLLQIFNSEGKLMRRESVNGNATLDIRSLPSGSYVLKYTDAVQSGEIKFTKVD